MRLFARRDLVYFLAARKSASTRLFRLYWSLFELYLNFVSAGTSNFSSSFPIFRSNFLSFLVFPPKWLAAVEAIDS